jgi:hypothetical protein
MIEIKKKGCAPMLKTKRIPPVHKRKEQSFFSIQTPPFT